MPDQGSSVGILPPIEPRHQRAVSILKELVSNHSGFALLVGEAGSGKTWALRQMIDAAAAHGIEQMCTVRCEQLENTIPYALWDRIAVSANTWFPRIPTPDLAQSSTANAQQILKHLSTVTRGVSSPFVLFVDDVHFVDRETLDVMSYLYPRLKPLGIITILATRPVHHARFERFREDAIMNENNRYWRLLPLDPEEVRTIAHKAWNIVLPDDAAKQLHHASAGNPLALSGLMSAITPVEVDKVRSTGTLPLRLTSRDRRPFDAMLRKAGDNALLAVQICAAAERALPVAVVNEIAERINATSDCAAAIDSSVLHIRDDGQVEVRHPLIGKAALQLMDPAECRRLYGELARRTQELRHMLAASETLNPELVTQLCERIQASLADQRPDAALQLLVRALALPTDAKTRDQITQLALYLACNHAVIAALPPLLQRIDDLLDTNNQALFSVWGYATLRDFDTAERIYQDWLDEAVTSQETKYLQATASLILALVHTSVNAVVGAPPHFAKQGLALLADTDDLKARSLRATLRAALAHAEVHTLTAQEADAAIEETRSLPPDSLRTDALVLLGGILLLQGRADDAASLLELVRQQPSPTDSRPVLCNLAPALLARALLSGGKCSRATALAERAVTPALHSHDLEARAAAPAVAASCLAATGDVDTATAYLDLAISEFGTQSLSTAQLLRFARLDVARARGGFSAMAEERDALSDGHFTITFMRFEVAIAHADLAAAQQAARDLDAASGPVPTWRQTATEIWISHLQAPTAASAKAVRDLCATTEGLPASHAWWLYAAMSSRLGDDTEATRAYKRAISLADDAGAHGWKRRMQTELEQLRTVSVDRLADLTERERRVCQLAKLAWTNAEIARELGITTRTVAFHMSNALQKLGLRSRKDLASLPSL